jgi:2-amino-4-hydroxy-6-hydroxymethyldihydropteridine diphosphokinase
MESQIFLLLGTNDGNRRENLRGAIFLIAEKIGYILQASSVYQTAPWGQIDQPDFYNQVVRVASSLEPESLLSLVLSIEKELGRTRAEKWGPRVIDIDILFYGHLVIDTGSLTIPHPEIQNRRFTLVPMNEIAPDFIHPRLNREIGQLLKICQDPLPVTAVTEI